MDKELAYHIKLEGLLFNSKIRNGIMKTENTLLMYKDSAASSHCFFCLSPRVTFCRKRCGLTVIYLNSFQKFVQYASGLFELRVDSYCVSQSNPSAGYTALLVSCKRL